MARRDARHVMDNHQGDGRQAALVDELGALATTALTDVEKVLRDDDSDGGHTDSDSESAPESDAEVVMLEEFFATGAHYDETLRAQFPLFRGGPPEGHPYPEAWSDGTPQSSGILAPSVSRGMVERY